MYTHYRENEAGILSIISEGELLHHMYPELEDDIASRLASGMTARFVMKGISFIDSSGIGFLLRLKSLVETAGCSFEIVNPSRYIRFVLNRFKLDTVFTIDGSLAAPRPMFEFLAECGDEAALAGCAAAV